LNEVNLDPTKINDRVSPARIVHR